MAAPALTADGYKAWFTQREAAIREEWVKSMELRITRDALGKCQKLEGVNHYEKCADLAVRYTNKLQEAQIQGVRNIDV